MLVKGAPRNKIVKQEMSYYWPRRPWWKYKHSHWVTSNIALYHDNNKSFVYLYSHYVCMYPGDVITRVYDTAKRLHQLAYGD